MQNNYYFLRKLTPWLKSRTIGGRLFECYSQNKDEIIFGFISPDETEFYLRAILRPDFCCLSFPQNLHRAKKNSVNLFSEILNNKVVEVIQYENERAFLIELENQYSLLFKMHGNRSNIVRYQNNKGKEIFNNRLAQDITIDPGSLHRPIDQSYDAFVAHEGNHKELFPTFGKEISSYLESHDYNSMEIDKKWELIQELLKELDNENYYITTDKKPSFILFNHNLINPEVFQNPAIAVSTFFVHWLARNQMETERNMLLKVLSKEIGKDQSYIQSTQKRLEKLDSDSNYRQMADLLMANLHTISKGSSETVVNNFYNNNLPVTIKLNTQLSPQKNAEKFYQKAKNQHKEIEISKQGLQKRERELASKLLKLETIEQATDLKQLRSFQSQQKEDSDSPTKNKPFHYFNISGFDVLVGKSARHNDQLLQQHSKKDDLWLHARDVSGSHVIIKTKGNLTIPAEVIEKAARLAAYNSKRKNDSLCPVIVTSRKFVRKRKGDPPGAVVVDREEVIMVEPSLDIS